MRTYRLGSAQDRGTSYARSAHIRQPTRSRTSAAHDPQLQRHDDQRLMTASSYEVGDWFWFPSRKIVRTGRQGTRAFSAKPRPVILAQRKQTLSVVFPRSSRKKEPEFGSLPAHHRNNQMRTVEHERHNHRAYYHDCPINLDGTVVDFRVTVRNSDFIGHGPRCKEPDNTGLVEQAVAWASV